MHELFGRLFHTNTAVSDSIADQAGGSRANEVDTVDPALLDTRGILRTLYGANINETNVEVE